MLMLGIQVSNIGDIEVSPTTCNHCNEKTIQRISIFGRYLSAYWLPIFPLGKKVVSECTSCLNTTKKKEFSFDLKELYRINKSKAKRRPIWHWSGLGVIAFLAFFIVVILFTGETDPRDQLLTNDISSMTLSPTMESDSISYKIKKALRHFNADPIDPSEYKYTTKIKGDKALILVQIPNLRKTVKNQRTLAIDFIEIITNTQKDLEGKAKYIGIKGTVMMMLVKTPIVMKNSKFGTVEPLYNFYGPKPVKKEQKKK